jgi:hypothetical protein
MKIYTIHTLAWSPTDDGAAVFVKEGFSWPGLVFGIFWTLWHGMWIASAALFVIALAAGLAVEAAGLNDGVASLVQLFLHLGVGVFGNDMRRWSLRRIGYVEGAVVAASRRSSAECRYFEAQAAGRAR